MTEVTAEEFRARSRAWFQSGAGAFVLDARVDWYEIGCRVAIDRRRRILLRSIQKRARKNRKSAEFRVGGLVGEMLQSRKPGEYTIRNRALTVRVDLNAKEILPDGATGPGWNVKVEWRAVHLAQNDPSLALTELVASVFGLIVEATTTRGDLARTFAGWRVGSGDRDRLVLRSRCKVDDYQAVTVSRPRKREPKPEEHTITRHGTAKRDTGFTVSPGNPLSARCYDKIAELVTKRDARWARRTVYRGTADEHTANVLEGITEKGITEIGIWRGKGWYEGLPVARVEFQVRGEALREIAVHDGDVRRTLRDPRAWERPDLADQVWRFCVGEGGPGRRRKGAPKTHRGWMRMVQPTRGRRKRAELDPRWRVAQRAFRRQVAPASRTRVRGGGSSWRQSFGATAGYLASAGELPPVAGALIWRGGRAIRRTPHEHAQALSDFSAAQLVKFQFEKVYGAMARAASVELLAHAPSPQGAAEWMLERVAAASARFAAIHRSELEAARAADAARRDEYLANGVHPWTHLAKRQEARRVRDRASARCSGCAHAHGEHTGLGCVYGGCDCKETGPRHGAAVA